MRPLDRLHSIRTKLGLLLAVTVALTAVVSVTATERGVSSWITVPVAIVVALAVTQVLARGMTSPLREMTAAARRMATGDYSQQVTATSQDEVGELARTFNAMAADLALVDRAVKVPIYGQAESMNLATAASVCLYESAFAQRAAASSSTGG